MIETARLILRPFLLGDAEDLYEYLHAPTVNCFMDMKLDTLEGAKEVIAERMEQYHLLMGKWIWI